MFIIGREVNSLNILVKYSSVRYEKEQYSELKRLDHESILFIDYTSILLKLH